MILPSNGRVSQGFHSAHMAVDIVDDFRSPIVAPEDGQITFTGQMGSGTNDAGLVVQIGNTNSRAHRLCHLDEILVSAGQTVKQGQIVGLMGYTGYTQPDNVIQGTHLHWVMWDGGVRVDGRNYVKGEPMIQDADNEYFRWAQLHFQLLGYEGTRQVFRELAVGKSWLSQIEILSDHKDATVQQNYAQLGRKAEAEGWSKPDTSQYIKVTDLYIKK